jgi:hypothetical protein
MNSADNSGAAFPQAKEQWDHDGDLVGFGPEGGMTKREVIATQALVGMGMWIPPVDFVDDEGRPLQPYSQRYQRLLREARAEWAVAHADALLAALKVTP